MIYIFSIALLYTFIKQKEQLRSKKNLFLFLFLSLIGITLGVIYMINPYIPSISFYLEKYLK